MRKLIKVRLVFLVYINTAQRHGQHRPQAHICWIASVKHHRLLVHSFMKPTPLLSKDQLDPHTVSGPSNHLFSTVERLFKKYKQTRKTRV